MSYGLSQTRVRAITRTAVLTVTAAAAAFATMTPVQAHDLPATATAAAGVAAEGEPTAPATVKNLEVPTATQAQKRTTLADDDNVVAELSATGTKDFGLVGITWSRASSAESVTAQIRLRVDGAWSAWKTLPVEDAQAGEGPDARAGTEPLWVGEADGVAARVSTADGSKPGDLRVATIDPGDRAIDSAIANGTELSDVAAVEPAVADAQSSNKAFALGSAPTDSAAAVQTANAPRPSIISRASWGAATGGYCSSPRTAAASKGAILHHTAGSNNYSASDSAAIVRAIQSYHVKAQNWCDVGYSFLVDKYGKIFEGRKGGVSTQVRGAHAGNFDVNLYMMGVSMIGNYDTAALTSSMKTSVVNLIAWRFAEDNVPATGTVKFDGRSLNRISGHRDVYQAGIRPATATACPGRYGAAWIPASGGLRSRVAAKLGSSAESSNARLSGPIASEYAEHRSSLGAQQTGIRKTYTSGMTYAKFSNGRAYAKGGRGYSIWGSIDRIHTTLGGTVGKLGYPTRGVDRIRSGLYYAVFSKGRVYSVNSTSYAGYGRVNTKYVQMRGTKSRLGVPITSIRETSRTQYQKYRNGHIKWVKKTGKYEVKVY